MVYKTVYTEVEVDVDMSEFDTEDLIEELELRGKYAPTMGDSDELIDKIFHLRRQGKPYERELDEYLYIRTGRAI
jgi:hypothetical protein